MVWQEHGSHFYLLRAPCPQPRPLYKWDTPLRRPGYPQLMPPCRWVPQPRPLYRWVLQPKPTLGGEGGVVSAQSPLLSQDAFPSDPLSGLEEAFPGLPWLPCRPCPFPPSQPNPSGLVPDLSRPWTADHYCIPRVTQLRAEHRKPETSMGKPLRAHLIPCSLGARSSSSLGETTLPLSTAPRASGFPSPCGSTSPQQTE